MCDKVTSVKLIDKKLLSVDDVVLQFENLVHKIIQPFISKGKHVGLEYEDLISIGYEALIRTYHNYDSRYGVNFMTYACPSMRGLIQASIDKQPAAHTLVNFSRAIKQIAMNIHYDNNQDRSYKELMEIYNITEDRAKNALKYLKKPYAISLDTYSDKPNEDNESLHETIGTSDDYSMLGYEVFIDRLNDFQKKVIYHLVYEEKSQTEIAVMYGKSQSYISRTLKEMRRIYRTIHYPSVGS